MNLFEDNYYSNLWAKQCAARKQKEELAGDRTVEIFPAKESPVVTTLPAYKMYKMIKKQGGVDKEIAWQMSALKADVMLASLNARIQKIEEQYPGYHENHELIDYRIEEDR